MRIRNHGLFVVAILSFLDLHHWQKLWYISMLFQVVKEEMVESCILDEETMVEMTLSSSLPSISTIQQVSRQVFAFHPSISTIGCLKNTTFWVRKFSHSLLSLSPNYDNKKVSAIIKRNLSNCPPNRRDLSHPTSSHMYCREVKKQSVSFCCW